MNPFINPGNRGALEPVTYGDEHVPVCQCLCEYCASKLEMLYDDYGYALWPRPVCPDEECTGRYQERCDRAHLYDEDDQEEVA